MHVSIIGMDIKVSGKNTNALAFVQLCLERDYNDESFLFLPAFAKYINGSYRWTEKFKDIVVIFTEYNSIFTQMLLDRSPEEVARNKKETLIFMDDLGCLVGEKP